MCFLDLPRPFVQALSLGFSSVPVAANGVAGCENHGLDMAF